MLEFSPIIPVNYPEGDKNKPWCPSTKLIQIGAELAGVELNPETFCGEKMTDARYSDGAIHYLESANYYPRVSCLNIHKKLVDQMKLVNRNIVVPDAKDVVAQLDKTPELDKKTKIIEELATEMGDYREQTETIERWRKTVFDISVSHKGDEPNLHFRQFESAKDILFDEVIGKVKDFIGALEKITGYKPMTISLHGGAKNCPQSPIMRIGR